MTALKRVRLEVDRTVRGRPFFARALAGYLEAPEYADLLVQLGGLVSIAAGPPADGLLALQRRDLALLAATPPERRCPTLHLMSQACRGWDTLLAPEERWAASIGVLGTSWTLDATERLALRFPDATALVEALGMQGPLSVQRLRREGHEVVAVAELVRGAVLGLAGYLDARWPAPMALVRSGGGTSCWAH